MDPETRKLLDQLNASFEQFKARDAQSTAETKKLGEVTAETKTTIEKIQDQMDQIEKKMQRAQLAGSGDETKAEETKAGAEQVKAFDRYIRRGEDSLTATEIKALSSDSDTDGGYLVPTNMSQRFLRKLVETSDMRAVATVETISLGDALEMVGEGAQNFESGKVGQRSARPETGAGNLRKVRIPVHENYAKPLVTQTQLDDTAWDVEGWISERVGTRRAVMEGLEFVSGSGNGESQGILSHADVASINNGHATTMKADALFDLFYGLPTEYARNAVFLMHRLTIREIRKLKDSQNQYLWQPGLAGGAPATLLDRPYKEIPDMPAIADGSTPIVFGDVKAAYTIVDRQGIRVQRDPYSSKPFIEFYTTWRVGGQVVLAEAIRKLKMAV